MMCDVRIFAAALAGILTWGPSSARADDAPPDHEPVTLSITVTAKDELPPGHRLLLLNTWDGATQVPTDTVVDIDWDPLDGPLQLVSIPEQRLEAIEAAGTQNRDALLAAMQAESTACTELVDGPFDGVHGQRGTERYDEIRWHYDVALEEGTCDAQLSGIIHLTDGDEVAVVIEAGDPAATDTPHATPAKGPGPGPSGPGKSGKKCSLTDPVGGAPDSSASLIALAGLALLQRARSRRR